VPKLYLKQAWICEKTKILMKKITSNKGQQMKITFIPRAEASPTHPGGRRKKFRWGQIFIIYFKV